MRPTWWIQASAAILRFALLTLGAMLNQAHATSVFSGKVTYVSDGDTIWVRPDSGGAPRKLRIEGIDAPEICQTGGEASRSSLEQRALSRQVEVKIRRNDHYGRALAHIGLDGNDLGSQMVLAGQAWSYRWRRDPGPYAAEEALARQARRGLFARDQPELPHDFRRRHGSCRVSVR